MPRVVVVGARRARQGIGPFVAQALARHGATVCAVVGSRPETARDARDALVAQIGGTCNAYDELERALAREEPDIVAIATPTALHREELEIVARHGAHCLCEKPLWWGAGRGRVAETEALVARFVERELHLALIAQWPFVLPTYFELFPHLRRAPVREFAMELSPISCGPNAVLDSLPHPLTILERLLGPGEVLRPRVCFGDRLEHAEIEFERSHAHGVTAVSCRLARCPEPPRPAALGINGHIARRRIEDADYSMFLSSSEDEISLPDPLPLLVAEFLRRIEAGEPTRARELVDGVAALERLFDAAVGAADRFRETGEGGAPIGARVFPGTAPTIEGR